MRPPFTRSPDRRSLQAAFTLVEMLISSGLAAIVMAVVMVTSMYVARTFEAMGNYADLNRASRQTLDIMTRDIRQAKTLTSYATNQLVFNDLNSVSFSYNW